MSSPNYVENHKKTNRGIKESKQQFSNVQTRFGDSSAWFSKGNHVEWEAEF